MIIKARRVTVSGDLHALLQLLRNEEENHKEGR